MKKTLLIWLSAIVCIVLLVATVVMFPSLAGIWHWNHVRSELIARGEKLEVEDFQKPTLPSEENYFSMPYFAEVDGVSPKGATQSETLKKALDQARTISKLHPAVYCRIGAPLDFSVLVSGPSAPGEAGQVAGARWLRDFLAPFESIRKEAVAYKDRLAGYSKSELTETAWSGTGLMRASSSMLKLLELHGKLALYEGRISDASEDIHAMAALARATKTNELTKTNSMSGQGVWGFARALIWHGMHKWSVENLRAFEVLLRDAAEERPELAKAFRKERALVNRMIDLARAKGESFPSLWEPKLEVPFPWRRASFEMLAKANYNLAVQQLIDLCEAEDWSHSAYEDLWKKSQSYKGLSRVAHHLDELPFLVMVDPVYAGMRFHDETELTRIALALELYRRARGSYPERLEEVAPDFIPEIPKTSIPGQTFHYSRTAKDAYRIWSFGWNGTDEGGTIGNWRTRDGDWGLFMEGL